MLQLNFTVGDFKGNTDKIIIEYKKAVEMGAELVVASELCVFGYPPKDMLLYENYLQAQDKQYERIKNEVGNIGLIIGVAQGNMGNGKPLFNSAIFIQNDKIWWYEAKSLLPTYDVFDEHRYFEARNRKSNHIYFTEHSMRNHNIAVLICEDIWNGSETNKYKSYQEDPVEIFIDRNIDHLIVINGSPYCLGKRNVRFDLVSGIARKLNCSVVYVNQVGGNDDLVFDGGSFAVDKNGKCIATAKVFEEDTVIVDTESEKSVEYWDKGPQNLEMKNLYSALVLGTRDYVCKNGFKKVVIGLSGGIDSALTACIAVDALGKENVIGVMMPSEFSSEGSIVDAKTLGKNLGIELLYIPISKIVNSYKIALDDTFKKLREDVTEENLQSRARGTILMALSNKFHWLVLSTGNKSELSVGYCTLYGDMAGGFAVISDLWKTQVYELANYVNEDFGAYKIPKNTIEKPPSAELRPNQKDTDSLPPYELLDDILKRYIEKEWGYDLILSGRSFEEINQIKETVRKVIDMVNRAEHKRKQMPPGPKISKKAFGPGRRMPIAAKYL